MLHTYQMSIFTKYSLVFVLLVFVITMLTVEIIVMCVILCTNNEPWSESTEATVESPCSEATEVTVEPPCSEATEVTDEQAYLNFLTTILDKGHSRLTRNARTFSMFSQQLTFDLERGFPLLTTKKMFWRGIFEELKFFMTGQTDTKILETKGVNIWKGNTSREFLDSAGLVSYAPGDIGPLYGFQWRHFGATYQGCNADYTGKGVDQLEQIIQLLVHDPFSRRIVMTTYHTDQLTQSPLPPCHGLTVQFAVDSNNRLCCQMYQRSCDAFLGCPFNIASYALLMHIICAIVNHERSLLPNSPPLIPGKLFMIFGDCHVYDIHRQSVLEQISRSPYPFPTLTLNKYPLSLDNIADLMYTDLTLTDYTSHPVIKAEMVA